MANTEWFKDGAPMPESFMQIKTFDAEKMFLYAQKSFSDLPGVASSMKLDFIRTITGQLVAQMKAMLVTGRIQDTVISESVKWPDSPWQMFKERHMPEWFKRKFPVHWHTEKVKIETNHYFVCPHIATDPQQHHVKFMATGTRLAGEMNIPGRY